MKVVGFLQNAWRPGGYEGAWKRASWLKALANSRTGIRMARLVNACPTIRFWWDNTTTEVGDYPGAKLQPDLDHVTLVLAAQKPDAVIAFGQQAGYVLSALWTGPLLFLPHPAYRVVTNRLIENAAALLNAGLEGRVRLLQEPGAVVKQLI